MPSPSIMPLGASLPGPFRIAARVWLLGFASLRAALFPFLDLIVRISIGQALLRSALVKLADWDVALTLATHEYPVGFMAPATAALVGLTIELVGGLLLIAGLMTRSAALAVAALCVVSQSAYVATDANLLIVAFMLWFAVHGAGGFSADRLIRPGLLSLPLPILARAIGAGEMLRRRHTATVLVLLRLWLAAALLVGAARIDAGVLALWLPLGSFAWLSGAAAIVAALALDLGLATALVALLLWLTAGGMQVMGMQPGLTGLAYLFLALVALRGAGRWSLDGAIAGWIDRHILFDRRVDAAHADWPHIVVVGGGFGGLACVAGLKRLPVRITLIDRNNYHLFQPLLYQVATAALSPADIATPIRSLFREDGNVRVLLGQVDAIDRAARQVRFGDEAVTFDYLVVATGAGHSYFGHDHWQAFAPGLKRIGDAIAVRSQVLGAFEAAEASTDADHVRRLLTFVIVGGGPTGVELAGAIAELARGGLHNEYRAIDPATARIVLVQSAPRLLPAFPPELSDHAARSLKALGVEVMLGARVTDIGRDRVMLGDAAIATETVLWAAGVVASPAAAWLRTEADTAGRTIVTDDMSIPGDPDIFVIGDTASSTAWGGALVPGLAPAAKQAGAHVARVIRARLSGAAPPPRFAYRHQGSLATIGRKAAVADFGRLKLHGATAWWLWGVIHVGFLVGGRNRVAVIVNWGWQYFTQQLGIRLITATDDPVNPVASARPLSGRRAD